ncbi:CarboxypepD_reg-like domain-containing protein [Lutibacter agarilyticus]|uniref:CarboxypepD_reg-like domain-containing protein n=1 Tax=Lutibacter agarilyticus TaxID=1109740 RepID=A0A238W5E7_9FLAO|nr:carboxypeptidase-like regulatory domain-containing protein [Lutibacter agarilyticus]SNR41544.1 CarboxypepD_reg-like domain-containing protein [Lutibacter agarilyticus]
MKRYFLAFCLLFSALTYSQSFEMSSLVKNTSQNGTIKGIILDNEYNNEPLAFATITIKNSNSSTTSEIDGSFSFNLKPGTYDLIFSFTGYKNIELNNVVVTSNATSSCNQILSALPFEPAMAVSQIK